MATDSSKTFGEFKHLVNIDVIFATCKAGAAQSATVTVVARTEEQRANGMLGRCHVLYTACVWLLLEDDPSDIYSPCLLSRVSLAVQFSLAVLNCRLICQRKWPDFMPESGWWLVISDRLTNSPITGRSVLLLSHFWMKSAVWLVLPNACLLNLLHH